MGLKAIASEIPSTSGASDGDVLTVQTGGGLAWEAGGGSGVTGATDSTLTLTGTTLGLNLANANSWAATQTVVKSALGATTTADGAALDNTTAATNTVVQVSPAMKWRGRAWNTSSSSSRTVDFRAWVQPTSSTSPSGIWKLQHSTNGATFADLLSVDSSVGVGTGVKITTAAAQSNVSPSTTRAMVIENAGSHTWTDYTFNGVAKANFGVDNQGGIQLWAGGGNYVGYYNKNSGSLYCYNYPTAIVHYGFGAFSSGVHAGSGSTNTSTLQNAGGTALKVKRITANQALDNTATHWLIDATTAAACAGTPTYSCSSHATQGACEANDAHGGCTWNTGNSCSVYNGDQSSCQSASGCTYDTASCGSFGDEGTCTSYGGCSWSGTDCSSLGAGTCGSTSGCTENTSDCSTFNGNEATCNSTSGCYISSSNTCASQGDESSCTSAGCSWNGSSCEGDNSTCAGSYFTSCSGTYYTCTGDYYTGSCSGTYGAGCTGTSNCAGIDDSTSCGAEAGCAWSAVLNATLPDGETCPDRTYWLYNDSSGGADVVILPYSGQTVNEGSSYTMASYRDWVHFTYFKKTGDCTTVSEGSCAGTSGCSANYSYCSWNSEDSTCSGNAVCTGIGDQGTCEGQSYYAGCTGTYVISKNWYKFGS